MLYLLIIPFVGIIHVSIVEHNRAKILSLKYTLATIIISCILLYQFDPIQIYKILLMQSNQYSLSLSLDGLSIVFIILTTVTIPLCVLASWESVKTKAFFAMLLLFETFTLLLWIADDLFLFYIAFEVVLVPLFLIIGIYSYGEGKTRAAYLLFFYTFIGSLFMLASFIYIYYITGTSNISILSNINIKNLYIWMGVFLSFAIKTPLIPFHNWILRAHVEAPVAGSIVLAGLTLKIASYGILRILFGIIPTISIVIAPLVNTFAVISIIYASVAAFRQTDIKCFVAYTSVAHIGVVVLGIFSGNFIGILGAIILSVAHGITSPALFYIIGAVIYDRYHNRTILYYRGITIHIPLAITILFLFTLANIGVPITANWIGELFCLGGSFINNPLIAILGTSTVFLSSCYSIWIYNRIAFGSQTPEINEPSDINRREFNVLITLAIFLVVLGCNSSILTNILKISVIMLLP